MSGRQQNVERCFRALVEGHLLRRGDVEEAFMAVAQAIWRQDFAPSAEGMDSVSLRRYGYLLETIKLFTADRATCRMLDTQISRARMAVGGRDVDYGFLPGDSPRELLEAGDELAGFWGLKSGIKVHRIPGFLEAHFALSEPLAANGNSL